MPRRTPELSLLMVAASSLLACSHVAVPDAEATVPSPLAVEDQSAEPGPPPEAPLGPPPEALAACQDLAAGEACTIALPAKALAGTCRSGPKADSPLACAPANLPPPPPGPPPGPPPEAFAACKDLAEGAACTVSLPDRALEGTCRSGPKADSPLACAPANLPPPPPGPPPGPPPEAFAACQDLAEGAACTVSLPERAIDGTCRSGPKADSPLACAPANLPPPPPGPPPAR